MSIVISQPMLFPWVGMLEQVRLSNAYVHYSDVQFSKGSFVNRVQVKASHGTHWLTVPLRSHSLGQQINEVRIDERRDWRGDHLDLLQRAYASAAYCGEMLALVGDVYSKAYSDIGSLSEASLMALCRYYGLDRGRQFLHSSELGIEGSSSRRVLNVVLALHERVYVTGHGASQYLDHELFERAGVRVEYMNYLKTPYPQLYGGFTPYVSALDLIANCGPAGLNYIRSGTIFWKDFLSDGSNRKVSD